MPENWEKKDRKPKSRGWKETRGVGSMLIATDKEAASVPDHSEKEDGRK